MSYHKYESQSSLFLYIYANLSHTTFLGEDCSIYVEAKLGKVLYGGKLSGFQECRMCWNSSWTRSAILLFDTCKSECHDPILQRLTMHSWKFPFLRMLMLRNMVVRLWIGSGCRLKVPWYSPLVREISEALWKPVLCKPTFATWVIVTTTTILTVIYSKNFFVSIVNLVTAVKFVGNRSCLKYPSELITPYYVTIVCRFKRSLLGHPAFVLWKFMCNIVF
jgi:hypothetical protein